ncbi:MAG: PIG-L family deacetylase, partial [Ferruginibacter sp.]
MKKLFLSVLASLQLLFCFAQNPEIANSADILLQMKKLNVLGSVLYIAAHPDDENNALLPYLANETLYRTAYLSLTRGDGGQNLIGDEQGIDLGLIRTQELLAARRVDGAEQYFTRAYEFGFSKSAEESLRIWDKEKILSDVVWVIRKYQPDIIIKRFPPDKRAGHGHHAASSVLADEAFTAAADPNRFPEQFKYGVKPWQAKRILWNTYNFGSNNTTSEDQLKIDIGGYNPLLGKSYGELGGEARTMHKSQGEGRPRRRGESYEYFTTLAGDAAKKTLMDGVDINWDRLPNGAAIQSMITDVINAYKPEQPELSVSSLIKIYDAIKGLPEGVWRNKKLEETQKLIMECSALYIEATTTQQNVVQGSQLKITFSVNNRKSLNAMLKKIRVENFDSTLSENLVTNQNVTINTLLQVADDKTISQPYWLQYPIKDGIFDVRDQTFIGKAENDPSFSADITINIGGEDFIFKQPVQYRFVDPVKGELYEPIAVLPKVELNFNKDNFISKNGAPVEISYQIKRDEKADQLRKLASSIAFPDDAILIISNSWKPVNNTPKTSIANQLGSYDVIDNFKSTSASTNTTEEISLKTTDGKYDGYTKTIAYDHIPTITYFPKAKANLVKLDIKIIGKKIGYIVGAGDKVPAALEAMGYEVVLLNESDLNDARLAQFDAIITGIRAYNLYEYLSDKNEVLNRYVKTGGNLIIQYMKSNSVGQKKITAGPYPFSIDGGTRVTEEDAKVNFLLPAS